METIGEQVKFYRNMKNWTQDRLAYESGLSQSMISDIEKNTSSPRYEILAKIANALEVAPANLLPAASPLVYNNNHE